MKQKRRWKERLAGLPALVYVALCHAMTAFAASDKDIKEVTDGIETLKKLVLSCVQGVGVILLAWGLLDLGTNYSAHDTTQQMMGVKKTVGGIIVIAVPGIIKLFM